jgi:hypothetical protein
MKAVSSNGCARPTLLSFAQGVLSKRNASKDAARIGCLPAGQAGVKRKMSNNATDRRITRIIIFNTVS